MTAEKPPSLQQSIHRLTIGFIGLGLTGKPMARNLHRAGARMIIHSRSQSPVDELAAAGMSAALSPAAVADAADIVILMLSDTPAVEMVVGDDRGILSTLRPGTLIIDMGTTAAMTTKDLARRVEAKGGRYIDAPVSGGTIGAESGELVIMAGGAAVDMARAGDIFNVLGKQTTHVGDVGAGQVAKAANQMIVGLTIGAVAEALALARKAGVDPARVREALQGGFADSRILEVHGQRMVDHSFAPGGKGTTQRKDMQQAIDLGNALGISLPATTLGRDLYDDLIKAGHGDLDHSALIKAIDPDWA